MKTNLNIDSSPDKRLFYSFCLLLIWIPLPLGSFHPWAFSMMEIWIYLLTITWCWFYFCGKVTISDSLRSSRFILFVFILWLIFIAIQLMPLPSWVIDFVSPLASAHWSAYDVRTLSLDIKVTRVSWMLSLSYVLIFFLTLVLVSDRKRLRIIAYTLVISGLFQAMYGAVTALSTHAAYESVAKGTFFNRNHLAGYLEMTIAIGIGLLIALLGSDFGKTTKKKTLIMFRLLLSEKARLRAGLIIMVIALVLTHSRMGNTAFFASLLITGTIGLIFSKYATRSVVILLVSLILVDILIVGQWFGLDKVKQRIEQTNVASEIRDEVYSDALSQWKDYRLTGSGLGSFYTVFPQYRGADVPGYHLQAHNDYLQFATETGLIGLTLLGLITVTSLFTALLAQYRRRDPLMRGMSFASIMGISAILIHSSVDFNLQIPANAVTFIVLLAIANLSLNLGRQGASHSST